MQNDNSLKLKLPQQNLAQFTHFRLDESAAREWAQHLPVANTRAVAAQLHDTVDDLNHCEMAPELRHAILGALSDNIQVTLANLTKRFLHQPLIMPEEPRQMAELTESLYAKLVDAYALLAMHIVNDPESIREQNAARLLCESIISGLEFAGRGILLNCQLYRPVALGGWLALHQLYALAERQGLASLPVGSANEETTTTVTATYLRGLMLGCIKPNQLRQSDMVAVDAALGLWSDKLEIGSRGAVEGLFLVDLESDQPPLYSALYGREDSGQCRQVSTEALVAHLQQLQETDNARGKPGLKLENGLSLPSNMLSHLVDCLGSMSMRNFSRVRSESPLTITIGLGAAHFHAAGGREFEHLVHGDEYQPQSDERTNSNLFLREDKAGQDPWRKANPEKDFVREEANSDAEAVLAHNIDLDEESLRAINEEAASDTSARRYPVYCVSSINASPGGYCIEWGEDLPDEVRAGAIASVQEDPSGSWSIAVIRWVSRLQSARTLIGLELLSPQAVAYGALIHSKKEQDTLPQRVLLLPEINLVGQPHTLVTARSGFRERQKISLLRLGERFLIQLTRQIAATASYAQFDFRYIKQLDEVVAEDKSGPLDASYDSLWSNI